MNVEGTPETTRTPPSLGLIRRRVTRKVSSGGAHNRRTLDNRITLLANRLPQLAHVRTVVASGLIPAETDCGWGDVFLNFSN